MAKGPNQKLKLLALLDILRTESDEDHPLSVPELIDALAAQDIPAERKSIYADIAALQDRGFDIVQERGRGYYLATREFELAELKLLCDAVDSSRSISRAKSRTLVKKLSQFCSRHQRAQLRLGDGALKTANESVLYSIDALQEAIAANKTVSFRYFRYDQAKQRIYGHGGEVYTVSPVGLLQNDNSYYLVALVEGQTRHYRVDRMEGLEVRKEDRVPGCGNFDLTAHARRHFGMFSGPCRQVKLKCPSQLATSVLDRFGLDAMLIPAGEGFFTVTVEAAVSQQFYGWLFGLGAEVEILSPADIREEYHARLDQAAKKHAEI